MIVDQVERKTFIAECVDGPVHGKLVRAEWCDLHYMAAVAWNDFAMYHLHVQPDGQRVWLYDASKV